MENNTFYPKNDMRNYLCHHGVKGQRWGIRRYQYSPGLVGQLQAARDRKMSELNTINKFYGGDKKKYKEEMKRRKQDGIKRRKLKNNPRFKEINNRLGDISFENVQKFDTDPKYRKKVREHILKLNRPDSKDWVKMLTNPKDNNYDADSVIDAVNEYLKANDKEYKDLLEEYRKMK